MSWLEELKVGDEVGVQVAGLDRSVSFDVVASISMARNRISVGGRSFDRDGRCGKLYRLVQPTPEVRAREQHRRVVSDLRRVRWEEVSAETAAAVHELLSQGGSGGSRGG